MTIVKVLNDFLNEAGIDSTAPVRAGHSKARELDAKKREEFRNSLLKEASRSNRWMMVWTTAAIFIIVLDAIVVTHFSGNEKILLAVVGGGLGAFISVLKLMKSMLSSHNASQTLLAILPNLPPEEWVIVAKVMVTEVLKGSK